MENYTHYHCSAEWHFSHLVGQGATLAPLVYNFALILTKPKPPKPRAPFFCSIPRLAEYFGADIKTTRKAVRLLAKLGFFETLLEYPGQPTQYGVIFHLDWKHKYPGRCCEKMATPWDNDSTVDKLAQDLYAASGGNWRVLGANMTKGMRNTGHSGDAIVQHFKDYVEAEGPFNRHQYMHGFLKQFMEYLRAQPVPAPVLLQ